MDTQITLKQQKIIVIVRGQFTPSILQPIWFFSRGLLRESEAEAASVKVISPQITVFDIEWLAIRITENVLQAEIRDESSSELLRDFISGFFELFDQAPVGVMGINRHYQYTLTSEDLWHQIGHKLVPEKNWSGILKNIGMSTVAVQGKRPDDESGYINAKVEPFDSEGVFGISIEINDHYILSEDTTFISVSDSKLGYILSDLWTESLMRSDKITQHIINLEG